MIVPIFSILILGALATNHTNYTTTLSYTTEAPNVTTDSPTVDIFEDISSWKWREMGICGYCSSTMMCCDAMAFGVLNGTVENWEFYEEELNCNGTKFSEAELLDASGTRSGTRTTMAERLDRVRWCKDYCTICYADPKTSVVSYCESSLEKNDQVAYMIVISFGGSLAMVIFFYTLQMIGRSYEKYRHLTILPMMDSYLLYFIIMYASLIVLYIITDPANTKNMEERVCCTQNTSLRAMILLVFISTEQVAPILMLLQQSFTRRAFRETFKEAFTISFPYSMFMFVWLTVPLNPLEVGQSGTTFFVDLLYGLGYAYVVMFLSYLVWRMWLNRQLVRAKPYILIYAVPYWIFLSTWTGLQLSEKTWTAAIGLLVGWNIIRLPLIYICLRHETAFWRREDRTGRLNALPSGVIKDLQVFLDRNRHLMIDYLDIRTGDKIGEGATAEVFKGKLRGKDVAVKLYTPSKITAKLLDEFAEEAEMMLPLKHDNVATINGLSVMPPHIVLVLPLYENGSVKQLLKHQMRIVVKLRDMTEECKDVVRLKEIENVKSLIMSPSASSSFGTTTSKRDSTLKVEEEDDDEMVSTKLCGDMELGEIKVSTDRRRSNEPPMRSNPSTKSLSEKLNRELVREKKRSSSDMDTSLSSDQHQQPSQLSALVSQTTSTLLHFKLPLFQANSTDTIDALQFENVSELDVLNWNERLLMAVEISAAIEYLHKQNPPILHRDIKPANIMLDRNNRVKLGDFGESTTTGDNAKKRRKTKKNGRTMSVLRLGRVASKKRQRNRMQWEKSESWSDRLHQLTFVCFRKCGRHAGWLSASCFCAGVFFPIIFVSIAVARSVAFAGFGALIIIGLGLVLLTDFLFHNIPRCEKFCSLKERRNVEDEDDLPRTIRGSPSWMAPEICRGKHGRANYGPAADVYSATIVIWQLLALEPLYPNMDVFDIMEFVIKGNRPRVPDEWPQDLKKILQDGWHQDPATRCTAAELHRRMFELLPESHPIPSHLLRKFSSNQSSNSASSEPSLKTKRNRRSKSGRIKWPSIMSLASSVSSNSMTTAVPTGSSAVHPFDKNDTAASDVHVIDDETEELVSEAQHKGGESLESLEDYEEEKE